MFTISFADPQDAARLADVQKRTFDADARLYQNKEEDGPPGYGSTDWQAEQMGKAHYYKLIAGNSIIGGMIVFPFPEAGECHLARIFIDPLYQNHGYGQESFRFLFETYPAARKWTLDTPSWAIRNHYFYEKLGFVRTGAVTALGNCEAIIGYERVK
ncbi:GNAT family N-acetyltransferase [Paenibacillus camerounensis]|uniref:GNAT family N-acetyltransferase n=1 Tax=Paenibacillus camerounensis TaxID=1243663 RepID=UPI0006949134|nr:GNAT family N-acetyltransferase [Paenibacillus camerounensis]